MEEVGGGSYMVSDNQHWGSGLGGVGGGYGRNNPDDSS